MPDEPEITHVLNPDAVRWAIDDLHNTTCNSSFLLYLFLRRRVIDGADPEDIPMELSEMKPYLFIPGGPPNKPLFRPFDERHRKNLSQFWTADHLPGSYALSSLRPSAYWMMDPAHTRYVLPEDHAERARKTFLADEPVSTLAFAGYLLRNFGFTLDCQDGHTEDLIAAFREVFVFGNHPVHEAQYAQLFEENTNDVSQWFVPWTEPPPDSPGTADPAEAAADEHSADQSGGDDD